MWLSMPSSIAGKCLCRARLDVHITVILRNCVIEERYCVDEDEVTKNKKGYLDVSDM